MKTPHTQEERLTRYIVFGGLFIILLLCGIIAYIITDLSLKDQRIFKLENFAKNVKVYNGINGDQGIQGPQGIQGIAGMKGDKGDRGDEGQPGQSIIGPQGVQGPQGQQGAQGEKGETGEKGNDGKTIFTRTNPLTGDQECRYAGNTEWQPEEECRP